MRSLCSAGSYVLGFGYVRMLFRLHSRNSSLCKPRFEHHNITSRPNNGCNNHFYKYIEYRNPTHYY